jgi:hypothetical protein
MQVNKDVNFGRGDLQLEHGHPNHFARQMRPVSAFLWVFGALSACRWCVVH